MFFTFFSIMIYLRLLNILPWAVQQSLVFIYSVYNSLPLITPNSLSIPPPPATSFLTATSLFCVTVTLFLFH